MLWNFILFILIILSISTIGALVVGYYLNLVKLKSGLNHALFNINDELEIKADLIISLLESDLDLNEYEINKSLNDLKYADTLQELAAANDNLSNYLDGLLNNPEANSKKIKKIISELNDNKVLIHQYKDFYNDLVYKYNHKLEVLPSRWVGSYFGFHYADYFMYEDTLEGHMDLK